MLILTAAGFAVVTSVRLHHYTNNSPVSATSHVCVTVHNCIANMQEKHNRKTITELLRMSSHDWPVISVAFAAGTDASSTGAP